MTDGRTDRRTDGPTDRHGVSATKNGNWESQNLTILFISICKIVLIISLFVNEMALSKLYYGFQILVMPSFHGPKSNEYSLSSNMKLWIHYVISFYCLYWHKQSVTDRICWSLDFRYCAVYLYLFSFIINSGMR